mmetsp:Transcript_19014/g.53624  ORF Transcript_19014/g.53624 Transcript_19014/m.53624 type:complete len:205 (+) Transcript_19014:96-710(+)
MPHPDEGRGRSPPPQLQRPAEVPEAGEETYGGPGGADPEAHGEGHEDERQRQAAPPHLREQQQLHGHGQHLVDHDQAEVLGRRERPVHHGQDQKGRRADEAAEVRPEHLQQHRAVRGEQRRAEADRREVDGGGDAPDDVRDQEDVGEGEPQGGRVASVHQGRQERLGVLAERPAHEDEDDEDGDDHLVSRQRCSAQGSSSEGHG